MRACHAASHFLGRHPGPGQSCFASCAATESSAPVAGQTALRGNGSTTGIQRPEHAGRRVALHFGMVGGDGPVATHGERPAGPGDREQP
eukprot:5220331-Alexandrium_andersonii.AAC.1